MVGLIMIAIVLAVGAFSVIAGVDSREGFTDGRGPTTPVGLS
jgi:hypothetical protein